MNNVELKSKIIEYIIILIDSSKIVGGGVFSSKYTLYRIDTPSKGWSVERKYKEFSELRAELHRLHPGYIIPPIYGESSKKDTDPKVIASRMQKLQLFIDDILKHPLLRSSELVYYFLHQTIQGDKKIDEFQKKLKASYSFPAPREIEEQKTADGKAAISVPVDLQVEIDKLGNTVPRISTLFKE